MKNKKDIGTLLIKYRLTTLAAIELLSVEFAHFDLLINKITKNWGLNLLGNLATGILLIVILFLSERGMNKMID